MLNEQNPQSTEEALQDLVTSLQRQLTHLKPLPGEQTDRAAEILLSVDALLEGRPSNIYRGTAQSAISMMVRLYGQFDESRDARDFLTRAILKLGAFVGLRITPPGVEREFAPPRRMTPVLPPRSDRSLTDDAVELFGDFDLFQDGLSKN